MTPTAPTIPIFLVAVPAPRSAKIRERENSLFSDPMKMRPPDRFQQGPGSRSGCPSFEIIEKQPQPVDIIRTLKAFEQVCPTPDDEAGGLPFLALPGPDREPPLDEILRQAVEFVLYCAFSVASCPRSSGSVCPDRFAR